jgi:hypothetical protein
MTDVAADTTALPIIENDRYLGMPLSAGRTGRSFNINMPQMSMGGLSESWLFKELGDMHWQMITVDATGNRLYATFTRISVSSNALVSYEENTPFDLEGDPSRFGAGIYFSEINFTNGRARIMSSFSMRGENGSNVNLLKGQPKIPPNCKIAKHATAVRSGICHCASFLPVQRYLLLRIRDYSPIRHQRRRTSLLCCLSDHLRHLRRAVCFRTQSQHDEARRVLL